jgi:hypothetical protein
MSYFQGKKDFISVGIGPLCYDSQYVHHREKKKLKRAREKDSKAKSTTTSTE